MLDSSGTDLNAHVGHEVEITGMIDPSSSSSSSSSSSRNTDTAGSSSGAGQHVRVSSVRMISSSCSK